MSVTDRLTKLTTDITNAYTSIENKGGTIPANKNTNNLPTAIDSIQSSNIIGATAEGESLSLANTKAMPYKDYVVKGKSEQETRSGKNKFNYASASDTNNTFLSTYRLFEISGLKANSVYNINNMSFNSSLSGKYCYIWKTNTYPGGITTILANPNEYYNQKVFETNEEGKVYLAMYPSDTTTWNDIIPYLQYAQIEEGREATSYEPYGASPSPDYPSEIHSVADDDINIFNAEKIENYNIKVKDNGKTIIMPVVTSGNGNTNTATKLNVLCPDLQVGDVIYIRFKRNLNNNRNKFIYLYDSNKIMYASENSPSYTITQEDLNSYVFLYGNDYDYGETEQCIITDFKIQKNTVPINYSPYNQGTVTIKQRGTTESNDYIIQTSPLRSLPNGVKDTIEADGIHRRVGRVVLDGSDDEGWNYNGSPGGKSTFYIMVSDVINLSDNTDTSIRALCNKFVGRSASNMVTNNLSNSISVISNKRIYVSLNDNTITTGTGFKTWLSTHNIEVLYELETEVIEPLTQNQATTMLDIIKTGSYEGTTNIYTDEDVIPTMKVDYYKKS